ncbi:MAG TPA: metallophosphoesterase [Stellaceae bacterium]|nr:metallophosphoesterase [Stellaceae bacterium]
MSLIAHISDLHFGHHDEAIARALLADLRAAEPTVIALSGDLTQRARRVEFAAARRFLDALPAPVIIVPGNHDVPLYNLSRRLFTPLRRYHRFITAERYPFFQNDDIAVLGIDTVRSIAVSNGRISDRQLLEIRGIFDQVPTGRLRVLVTHHPLVPPPDAPDRPILRHAIPALSAIEAAGVDLLLAGHYHHSYIAEVGAFHRTVDRSILVAQAGTAISTRTRAEENAYNLISTASTGLSCRVRMFRSDRFVDGPDTRFDRVAGRWRVADSPPMQPSEPC